MREVRIERKLPDPWKGVIGAAAEHICLKKLSKNLHTRQCYHAAVYNFGSIEIQLFSIRQSLIFLTNQYSIVSNNQNR